MRLIAISILVVSLGAACGGAAAGPEVRGKMVFTEHCANCHSLEPGVVIVGPSLAGVASRAGSQGTEPRAYLERAILSPAAEIVPGYSNLMPADFERKLAPSDLEALLAFLLTLG